MATLFLKLSRVRCLLDQPHGFHVQAFISKNLRMAQSSVLPKQIADPVRACSNNTMMCLHMGETAFSGVLNKAAFKPDGIPSTRSEQYLNT